MSPRLAAVLVAIALGAIALLHAYWGLVAVGGAGRRSVAIPEVEGRPLFVPTRAACFAVALALAAAGYLLLVRAGIAPSFGLPWLGVAGAAIVGAVLILRAIGDFRYVGFFKRVVGTDFATLDTRLFSPLCLALGALALWAAFAPRR